MLDNIKIAVVRLPRGETAKPLLIDSVSEDFKFMYDKDRNVIGMYLTFEVGENKDMVETDDMDIIEPKDSYLETLDPQGDLVITRLHGTLEEIELFINEALPERYTVMYHKDNIPVAIYTTAPAGTRKKIDRSMASDYKCNLGSPIAGVENVARRGGGTSMVDEDEAPRCSYSDSGRGKEYAEQLAAVASVLGMGSLNGSGAAKLASELSGYNIDAFDKMSKYNDKKVQDIYNVIHKKLGGYWSGRFIKLSTIESKYALSHRLKITDTDGNLVGDNEWKTNQK